MKTFAEFLAGHGDITDQSRSHYLKWVKLFQALMANPEWANAARIGQGNSDTSPGRGSQSGAVGQRSAPGGRASGTQRAPASHGVSGSHRPVGSRQGTDGARGAGPEPGPDLRRVADRQRAVHGPPSPPTVRQTIKFLSFLDKRYEPWQVKQARRALQLYCYYLARCSLLGGNETPAHQKNTPAQPVRAGGLPSEARSPGWPDLPPRAADAGTITVLGPDEITGWDDLERTATRLMRLQHYSPKTETAYLFWTRRF